VAVGVAYFGNRIPRHVAKDMSDLADRGFTGVLHTFSENDLAHYPGTIRRIVEISREEGLEVQLSPWGLGGIFGGEAETAFTAGHPEGAQVLSTGRPIARGLPQPPGLPRVRPGLGRGGRRHRRGAGVLGRAPLALTGPVRWAPRCVDVPV
jgi:hypothetical protein